MSTGNDAGTPLFGCGAHGYRFDAYVAAMTRQMLEELLARRDGIPQPVRKLHWTGHQGYNELAYLAINGQEWPDDFGVETSIPVNCEWPEEDKVMLRFLRVHGGRIEAESGEDGDDDSRHEDAEDAVEYGQIGNFKWGDRFQLPACALIHEQLLGLQWLADELRRAGIQVGDGCTLVVGDGDNEWEDFGDTVLESFAGLPEAWHDDVAAMFYESPQRQAWLKGGAG